MKQIRKLMVLALASIMTGCSTSKVVYIKVGFLDDDLRRYSDDIYNSLITRNKGKILSYQIDSTYIETLYYNGFDPADSEEDVTFTVDIDFAKEIVHINKHSNYERLYSVDDVPVFETDCYYFVDEITRKMVRYSVDEIGYEDINYLGTNYPDSYNGSSFLYLIETIEEYDIKVSFFTSSLNGMFSHSTPADVLVDIGDEANLKSCEIQKGYNCEGYLLGNYFVQGVLDNGTVNHLTKFTFDFSIENYLVKHVEKNGSGRWERTDRYSREFEFSYSSRLLKKGNSFEMPEISDELFTRI